jgi:hypothetical protein
MEYEGCKGEVQFDDEHHICPLRTICLRYVGDSKNIVNFYSSEDEDCGVFINVNLVHEE